MKIFFGLAIILGFSQSAKAGFMVEPYLGTLLNSDVTANDCNNNCKSDVSGNVFGAKAGFKSLGLSVGLDYQMTSGTSQNEASGSDELDIAISEYGIHVGYDFPILFRVYATYWLNSEINSSNGPNYDVTFKKASGYTLGVGYSFLPMVALNLEIKNLHYSEYDYDFGAGGRGSGFDADNDLSIMALKVSIPLSI